MSVRDTLKEKKLRENILKKGLPLKVIAKVGRISSMDCLQWWIQKANLPKETNYEELLNFLGLSSANLTFLDTVSDPLSSSSSSSFKYDTLLPAKYSDTPLSYVSSSRHILEVIQLQFGQLANYNVLTKLGVAKEYFDNIENKISIKFFEDLLLEYSRLCGGSPNYDFLSKALYLTVEESTLSKYFHTARSYKEAYEQIEASVSLFDQNFEYHFHIGQLGTEIITKPSAKLIEAVKNEQYGSEELYKYRSKLFGNMVTLCGMKPLKIEVTNCISVGSTVSRYIARYP